MPDHVMHGYPFEHPAPHADRVGLGLLFSALCAAPAAWTIQVVVNYGLSSYACFPRQMPLPAPKAGWQWLWSGLLAINIAALVISAAGIVVSLWIWRRSQHEIGDGHTHLVEAGEGRTRFLAVWGIWAGVWFLLGIVFNTVSVFGVPACGS